MTIENQIIDFIAENLLFSDKGFKYSDQTSFLEEGIVDSIGVLELVAFVEENFAFTVDDMDVTPDNFDSVEKLGAYVRSKQGTPE